MMIKRVKYFFTIILLSIITTSLPVYAKDEAHHNMDLESIMFDGNVSNKEAIDCIEAAAELTIDQFKGAGKDNLAKLNRKYSGGGSPLPHDISEIDFSAGSEHRKYTHRGWDFQYSYRPNNYQKNWQETWLIRREILLYTVDSIFEFTDDKEADSKYSRQCNSFCALVYYVHLIGDHENDYQEDSGRRDILEDKMGVGGLCDKNKLGDIDIHNPLNLDMIDEILRHSEVLFGNQKRNSKYLLYRSQLKALDMSFRKIVDEDGHIIDYKKYYKNTEKLRRILTNNLYDLLSNEEFFCEVFG